MARVSRAGKNSPGLQVTVDPKRAKAYCSEGGEQVTGTPDRRRKRRDYSKPHRLFVEDTPREVRAILEEAAAVRAQPSVAASVAGAGASERRGFAPTEAPPG